MIKLALNASKARQLAKKYNIIPEAGTAWKWALRNKRKGKSIGEPPVNLVKKLMSMPVSGEHSALYGKGVKKYRMGALSKPMEVRGVSSTDMFKIMRPKNYNRFLKGEGTNQYKDFLKTVFEQF